MVEINKKMENDIEYKNFLEKFFIFNIDKIDTIDVTFTG